MDVEVKDKAPDGKGKAPDKKEKAPDKKAGFLNRKIITAVVIIVAVFVAAAAVLMLRGNKRIETPPKHTTLNEVAELDNILKGVYVGSVDVSDMSVEEAEASVRDLIEYMRSQKLTVNIGDTQDTLPIADAGFTWVNTDVCKHAYGLGRSGNILQRFKDIHDIETNTYVLPLERSVDDEVIEGFIEQEAEAHNRGPVDATIEIGDEGELIPVEGQDGMEVNTSASLLNIHTYLVDTWKGDNPVCDMKIDVLRSRGSAEELSKVKDVLGRASTDFSSSSESRYQNIVNGTSKINGIIMYPGDSISMLERLLPFEPENGYSMAPSYVNGKSEDTFGGGICQVSTTLYNAVLRAELEVDERHNHSMTVSYVEPAMDAAIADGSKDFIFTNNSEYPIYLVGETDDGIVTVTIFGVETRNPGRSISFESEVIKEEEPVVELVADPTLALGNISQTTGGRNGLEACLWKIIEQNGQTEKEEVNYSVYDTQNIKFNVGTSTDSVEAANAIYGAVDTNNLDRAYSVIDAYS